MQPSLRSVLSRRVAAGAMTLLFVLLLVAAGLTTERPSQALPVYARRYHVTCDACHSVAPRLNLTGLAFQANNFNWPGGPPPDRRLSLSNLPVSGIGTVSWVDPAPDGTSRTDFRRLALYASDGFSVGHLSGGYLVNWLAASRTDERPGGFDNAFVALPVAGKRGQWTLMAGQISPLNYSWDDHNDLSDSAPTALGDFDGFSLEDPSPALRVDYFSGRGHPTPDGTYVSLGAPLAGQLALNRDGRLGDGRGVYGQAFRRHGYTTLGVFGYDRSGNHLEGLIGSRQLTRTLFLWGAGSVGHDGDGSTRRLSVQATYLATARLALVGRFEALDGSEHSQFPVVAVTCYPLPQQFLRLSAESVQQPGNRATTVFAYVQF